MLRFIHNRSIVKYVLSILGIVLALYFAWSFYPFGEWSGKQFLGDLPFGPTMLGLICAGLMGFLVLLMLFHKEYMKEDVKAFSALKGDTSFVHALNAFVWLVIGLECFSVLFRITLLGTNKFNAVMFGIGVFGILLSWILGKVLHAQVNRPAEVEAGRIINEAGNKAMEIAGRDMDKLSPDELRQVRQGNFNPLNKISDMRNAQKNKKERERLAREQEKDRKASEEAAARERNKNVADQFLQPRTTDPVDIIDTPIQNRNGTYSKN